jgi:hypothetical protein
VKTRHHSLVLDEVEIIFHFWMQRMWATRHWNTIQKRSSSESPVKFISLSAGSTNHSLGIAECDGSLWSWGSNSHGQLGQGEGVLVVSFWLFFVQTTAWELQSVMGLYDLGVQTLTDNWDKEKKFQTSLT